MNNLRNIFVGVLLFISSVAVAEPLPNGRFADLDISELRARMIAEHEAWQEKNDEVGTFAPAPPLTQLQVYAVRSEQYPSWEYLGESQYSTVNDHGGAWMDLVTYEYGYGYSAICKMDGFTLQKWHTEYITDYGNTVIGFINYWVADGHQSGQWTYQNTSTNYPWNTMSDWANVR